MAKILIIEDEPDQVKMVKLRLEANNFSVLSAGDAQEGIVIAREEKPDLILLDMLLPDMNGLDAAKELKKDERTKDIPIIAVTAMGTPNILEECMQAGISVFMRKPYDSKELVDKIKEQLEV